MPFSSPSFLFLFLPLLLLAYGAAPGTVFKNQVLLAAGLVFFAWLDGLAAGFLAGSILLSWAWALFLDRHQGPWRERLARLGCLVLLAALACFKLGPFARALRHGQSASFSPAALAAPLGLALVVFQTCSYLWDLQAGLVSAETSLSRYALGASFFSALPSGPLLRYAGIRDQLAAREVSQENLYSGALRFSFGLAKQVLVADTLATGIDRLWLLDAHSLSAPLALTAVLFFYLQIYFSFSGATDMACGLALMFGLRLPESFRYPARASSVHDFWKRWHITLGEAFRDYGLRRGGGAWGRVLNLGALILFFSLCYGACWNVLLAGAWFGLFLGLEGFLGPRLSWQPPRWLAWAGTQAVVLAACLLWRAPDLPAAWAFLHSLLGSPGPLALPIAYFLQRAHGFVFFAALAAALGLWPRLCAWAGDRGGASAARALEAVAGGLCLLLALARIMGGPDLPHSILGL